MSGRPLEGGRQFCHPPAGPPAPLAQVWPITAPPAGLGSYAVPAGPAATAHAQTGVAVPAAAQSCVGSLRGRGKVLRVL